MTNFYLLLAHSLTRRCCHRFSFKEISYRNLHTGSVLKDKKSTFSALSNHLKHLDNREKKR